MREVCLDSQNALCEGDIRMNGRLVIKIRRVAAIEGLVAMCKYDKRACCKMNVTDRTPTLYLFLV